MSSPSRNCSRDWPGASRTSTHSWSRSSHTRDVSASSSGVAGVFTCLRRFDNSRLRLAFACAKGRSHHNIDSSQLRARSALGASASNASSARDRLLESSIRSPSGPSSAKAPISVRRYGAARPGASLKLPIAQAIAPDPENSQTFHALRTLDERREDGRSIAPPHHKRPCCGPTGAKQWISLFCCRRSAQATGRHSPDCMRKAGRT